MPISSERNNDIGLPAFHPSTSTSDTLAERERTKDGWGQFVNDPFHDDPYRLGVGNGDWAHDRASTRSLGGQMCSTEDNDEQGKRPHSVWSSNHRRHLVSLDLRSP